MLRNIKLTVAYDGTDYNGWQKQNAKHYVQQDSMNLEQAVPTIQEQLEQAIKLVTKEEATLIASGRTDAGVHALGQIANFTTNCTIPVEKLPFAINPYLNADIRVLKAEAVDLEFNSRFSAKKKTYLYQIYNDRINNPLLHRYALFVPYKLDIELIRLALRIIEGEHDFNAFMSSKSDVKSTMRTIYSTSVEVEDKMIKIRVTGNGFLYNMVRIIVGTMIKIGSNKISLDNIYTALDNGKRELLGPTAGPEGLFLEKVEY